MNRKSLFEQNTASSTPSVTQKEYGVTDPKELNTEPLDGNYPCESFFYTELRKFNLIDLPQSCEADNQIPTDLE